MVIFPSILGVSLLGMFFLSRRYLREAFSLSQEELENEILKTRSVRSDIWDKFISPIIFKFRETVIPFFLKSCERLINRVRVWVSKLEGRLRGLSDDIHGTAINMEIGRKTEYWQNLNTPGEFRPPESEAPAAKIRRVRTTRKRDLNKIKN